MTLLASGDGNWNEPGHERIDLTADAEGFLALDADALLVQLCQDLGLTPPEFHPPAPAAPAPRANTPAGPDSS